MSARLRSQEKEKREGNSHEYAAASTHVQPKSHRPQIHARQTPPEHLLDVELPMGIPTRSRDDGKPVIHDDRSPYRAVAELRDSGVEPGTFPPGDCGHAGTVPPLHT